MYLLFFFFLTTKLAFASLRLLVWWYYAFQPSISRAVPEWNVFCDIQAKQFYLCTNFNVTVYDSFPLERVLLLQRMYAYNTYHSVAFSMTVSSVMSLIIIFFLMILCSQLLVQGQNLYLWICVFCKIVIAKSSLMFSDVSWLFWEMNCLSKTRSHIGKLKILSVSSSNFQAWEF